MTAPEPARAVAWRLYLALAAGVFLGCLVMTGGHLMSPDGELLYRTSEALALRGELHVTPIEYDTEEGRAFIAPTDTFATVQGRGGNFHVQYLPLQAVLAVPLVWLAEMTRPAMAEAFFATLPRSPVHFTVNADSAWRRAVVVMGFNPLVMALTAVVLARFVLFLTAGNRRVAVLVALLWAFGTMALPHSRTFFTEPLAGLFFLIGLDALARWICTPLTAETSRRRLMGMLVLGAACIAGIWTRMDSPLLAAGLGVALVATGEYKRRYEVAYGLSLGRMPVRDYAIAGTLMIAGFAALVVFNNWRFGGEATLLGGGYSHQPEKVRFSTPLVVGLHGLLLSPGKGLFFFSPALLLAMAGWCCLPRAQRWLAVVLAISVVPFALAMTMWQNWEGGWCWGPRHIMQLHAPLMIGATFLLVRPMGRLKRITVAVVATLALGVQVFGSLQAPMDFYHELYRTPEDGLALRAAYRPEEAATIDRYFQIVARNPATGAPAVPTTAMMLPPPMVDSLYIPAHTQWAGYPLLFREGYCDWWLLARVMRRQPVMHDLP